MATRTLRECIEDLPQEIYDEVYALTFTPPPVGQIILIDKSYKPPSVCQVNRASRAIYLSSYRRRFFVAELSDLVSWLKANEKIWQWVQIRCWSEKDSHLVTMVIDIRISRTLTRNFDKGLAARVRTYKTKEDAMKGINPMVGR